MYKLICIVALFVSNSVLGQDSHQPQQGEQPPPQQGQQPPPQQGEQPQQNQLPQGQTPPQGQIPPPNQQPQKSQNNNVCHEKRVDGAVVSHRPGGKWLELSDDEDHKPFSKVVIKYEMICHQTDDSMVSTPIRCYFKDDREAGVYVEPGCAKRTGVQWMQCSKHGTRLDASVVPRRTAVDEELKICD